MQHSDSIPSFVQHDPPLGVSAEEIRLRAEVHAQKRGLQEGYEAEDWLVAEEELRRELQPPIEGP